MEPSRWLERNPIRPLYSCSVLLCTLCKLLASAVVAVSERLYKIIHSLLFGDVHTSTMSPSHPQQAVLQDVLSQLQTQITEFQTLLPLLCLPLARVNLLPPQFRRFNSLPSGDVTVDIARVFPLIQRALLESILPTWEAILEEEGCSALTLQYFCPDAFSNASSTASDVALCAYSIILSLPLHQRCVDLLLRLAKEYPIDRLFHAVSTIRDPARRSVSWDDCLRNIFTVPTKIANALKGKGVPTDLGLPHYYNDLCVRSEFLIHALSKHIVAGQYFFTKHLTLGFLYVPTLQKIYPC
jgi:telomere length regulation protein